MMMNYKSFLGSKINEHRLYGEFSFEERLGDISRKHPNKVGKMLHFAFVNSLGDKSLPLNYNWIRLGDSDDKVKFVPDNKVSDDKVKGDKDDIFEMGKQEISIGKFAKYVIDFLISNKEELCDYLKVYNAHRTQDFFRRYDPDSVTPKDIEEFVNIWKSYSSSDVEFELVEGEKIREYYLEKNYEYQDLGELGSSCMKYIKCQSYLDIYVENRDKVKLLILVKPNKKIVGRALIWKLDWKNSKCLVYPKVQPEFYMDRVYAIDKSTEMKFYNFAKQQGYLVRWNNTKSSIKFLLGDTKVMGRICCRIYTEYEEYPYMDTFNRYSPSDRLLMNIPDDHDEYNLTDTDGNFHSRCYCSGRDEDCGYCKKSFLLMLRRGNEPEWAEIVNQLKTYLDK